MLVPGETYFNKRKVKLFFWKIIIYYELFTRSLVSGVRNRRERERVFSTYIFSLLPETSDLVNNSINNNFPKKIFLLFFY